MVGNQPHRTYANFTFGVFDGRHPVPDVSTTSAPVETQRRLTGMAWLHLQEFCESRELVNLGCKCQLRGPFLSWTTRLVSSGGQPTVCARVRPSGTVPRRHCGQPSGAFLCASCSSSFSPTSVVSEHRWA